MKKLLIIAAVVLSIFLIYLSTLDRKVFFLTLSSEKENMYTNRIMEDLQKKNILEKYVTGFNENNYRVTDFSRMIESNKSIKVNGKEQSIKNALIKADMVTLDIGKVDFFSKLAYETDEETLYDYVDEIADDMRELLELVRLYCKEDIYILKIYNPNDLFPKKIINYMNDKIKKLANSYKLHYIEYTITPDMVVNKVDLNARGEESIYHSLSDSLSKTLFSE